MGGLFVNIDSIWVGIRWLQYFSMFKYTVNVSLPILSILNTDIIRNYYKILTDIIFTICKIYIV